MHPLIQVVVEVVEQVEQDQMHPRLLLVEQVEQD